MKKLFTTLGISLVAATSQAATVIEFTTAEGYANGDLNGQPTIGSTWNANTAWDVADAALVTASAKTTSNNVGATFGAPIILTSGQSYSLSANFQFIGSYTAGVQGTSSRELFGLGIASAISTYTAPTTADATMVLRANTDGAGTSAYNLAEDGTAITGISTINGFNTGDVLRLDYTLTLGADAASTFYTVQLFNLTDSTDTGLGTETGIDAAVYTALTTTGGFGYFETSFDMTSSTNITTAQVNSFTLVPEPSTFALLGLGLCGLLVRRRRA